jgi:hypothetical protein
LFLEPRQDLIPTSTASVSAAGADTA